MRRVVLQHTQGPWTGLHQIVGRECELRAATHTKQNLPMPITVGPFTAGFGPGARESMAGLLQCKPRYWLYREWRPELTGMKAFDPAQQ